MQISINLSSTPYLDVEPLVRRLRVVAITLGALTLSAAILVVVAHFKKNAFQIQELQVDGAIARESVELSSYRKMLEMPENVSIANRALALNSLFDEKSFSWTLLMKQFEGVVPPDVQLATIQPIRAKDSSISIRMHVIGPREKVLELMHGIEASKSFTLPHVTAETAHNSDSRPNQRAAALTDSSVEEFDIEAGYDEEGAPLPQPAGELPAERETASAATASAAVKATVPAQMTATMVSPTAVRPGGVR